MDCPIGSSGQYYAHLMQGVCYCDACLEAFRVYLAQRYTPRELADLGVWGIVRKHPTTGSLAVHLLNREHDHTTDKVSTQKGFQVSIREDMLEGDPMDRVVLHAPGDDPVNLNYETIDDRIVIDVPQLYLWDVVILRRTRAER
jgi:hypothetical protein